MPPRHSAAPCSWTVTTVRPGPLSVAFDADWPGLRKVRDSTGKCCVNHGKHTAEQASFSATIPIRSSTRQVLGRLRNLEHLARFQAYPAPPARRDPWKGLDLTDTLLLTGRIEEGLNELRSAIELTDPQDRESSLTSVIAPLRDYLTVDVLDESTAEGLRAAIDLCEEAISAARAGIVLATVVHTRRSGHRLSREPITRRDWHWFALWRA
jgi:hypothetical protein